tara:strand:- start:927 stop:1898 length:972 start_codon:yes stop_codon:yes gene_type:complete
MGISFVGMKDWADAADEAEARRQENAVKLIELDMRYGSGSGGYGRSGTSATDTATRNALLKQINERLPEDSKVAPQLVDVSLETLEKFDAAQQKLAKFYQENDMIYSPEQAEDDVISIHREVIKSGGKLDEAQIYAILGIDESMAGDEVYGGKTYADIAKSLAEGSETVGLAFQMREPIKPASLGEQSQLRELYIEQLSPTIEAEIAQINARAAQGNPQENDEARALELNRALDAISSEAKDYSLAARIVGPMAAIRLMETNPRMKAYSYLINKNLNFTDDVNGNEMFKRAITSGLLGEGDTYFSNGVPGLVTAEIIEKALKE